MAHFDKARAALDTIGASSANPVAVASLETNFGATLAKAGACGLAIPHYEHALEVAIGTLGEDNGEVTVMLSNVGLCYMHLGELAKSHDALARALALREKLFGARSPLLIAALDNYAELLAEQGDYDTAFPMFERARSLGAISPGTAHPNYHQILTDYAQAEIRAGKTADAHRLLDEAVALEKRTSSNILPASQTAAARLALAEHKWPDAETLATAAIAGFEAQGGNDQPELWLPLTYLAQAKLARNDAAGARELVDRALAIAAKAHIPDHDLAPTRELAAKLH